MVGPFKEGESWISAFEMCRAPLVQFEDGLMRTGSVKLGSGVAITIVVIVDSLEQYNTLTSLANLEYDTFEVIFVFRTTELYKNLAGWIRSYDRVIPIKGVFRAKGDLELDDAILAGLQGVTTSHVCFMFNADMIHKHALARAAEVLSAGDVDCYKAIGFQLNKHAWGTPFEQQRADNSLLVVSRTLAVRQAAKQLTGLHHPYTRLWLFERAAEHLVVGSELAYFRAERNYEEAELREAYNNYIGGADG